MPTLDDWELVVAMPAVALRAAVEAGDTAVVPFADPRYQHIMGNATVATFLSAFRTAFGVALQPSVVIRNRHAPRILAEDLVALRNIVALSAVIKARTDRCGQRFANGPVYAELFDVYPVNVARGIAGLTVQTGHESGFDTPDRNFHGQPHPAYIYPDNVVPELDETLLRALLSLWMSSVRRGEGGAFRRRIFGSLEMAYRALGSPFTHMGSQQDHGVALSLWVSAFETLAHPGSRNVHFGDVESLIRSVPWVEPRLALATRVAIEYRRALASGATLTRLPKTTRSVQVYQRLYRIRNTTLHGGRIPVWLIARCRRWNHLHEEVPAVFRGVLLALLATRRFHRYPREPATIRTVAQQDRYSDYLGERDEYRRYEAPLLRRCRRP